MIRSLNVMVLAGGPDRERPVSLVSGQAVADALLQAGHRVTLRDILPDDLTALDEFERWPAGDKVIFPVLHGAWGEGGGVQQLMQQRQLSFVGCRADAAWLCMDKAATKQVLDQQGIATPAWQLIQADQPLRLEPPLVLKPLAEGSSIDIAICKNRASLEDSLTQLIKKHDRLLAERFIAGKELTIGVIDSDHGPISLPPIQIIPATEFYDYQAKYHRDDTQYLFDIDLPADTLDWAGQMAVATYRSLGCRHMSRVDFLVDQQNRPWVLEVNTIPGFTSHSLLPKAAARAGILMAELVDRLARLALASDQT